MKMWSFRFCFHLLAWLICLNQTRASLGPIVLFHLPGEESKTRLLTRLMIEEWNIPSELIEQKIAPHGCVKDKISLPSRTILAVCLDHTGSQLTLLHQERKKLQQLFGQWPFNK